MTKTSGSTTARSVPIPGTAGASGPPCPRGLVEPGTEEAIRDRTYLLGA
jgi:hypothetical protein